MAAQSKKLMEKISQAEGSKVLGNYWTLGRYDIVIIVEGKDERSALKSLLQWSDIMSTETLIAIPRDETVKLVE